MKKSCSENTTGCNGPRATDVPVFHCLGARVHGATSDSTQSETVLRNWVSSSVKLRIIVDRYSLGSYIILAGWRQAAHCSFAQSPPTADRRDAAKPRAHLPESDRLGIGTWRNYGQSGVQRYIWDEVNRLKSLCGTSEGARYEYRADGMRVKKITGLTIEWVGDEYSASGYYDENLNQDLPTVRYFYDGQMPMEEDSTYKENSVSVRDYTQYGLGARGIDYIRNVHHSSGATVVFPIYDGHGNMVYTLSRGGNDTFSLGNKRIYGVWGDLRYDGNPNAGPNTQYCANLGHKKDNESGLIYMRARYYEPWTGRFISEDKGRDGWNWYVYCKNNPLTYIDFSGNNALSIVFLFIGVFSLAFTVLHLVPALQEFVTHLAKAQNGLEVEEIWANFMAGFRGTQLLDDDISGLIRLVGLVFAMKAFSKGKYPVLYDIGVFIAGLNLGIKASFLCYAYQLRIAWYIDDINRD